MLKYYIIPTLTVSVPTLFVSVPTLIISIPNLNVSVPTLTVSIPTLIVSVPTLIFSVRTIIVSDLLWQSNCPNCWLFLSPLWLSPYSLQLSLSLLWMSLSLSKCLRLIYDCLRPYSNFSKCLCPCSWTVKTLL